MTYKFMVVGGSRETNIQTIAQASSYLQLKHSSLRNAEFPLHTGAMCIWRKKEDASILGEPEALFVHTTKTLAPGPMNAAKYHRNYSIMIRVHGLRRTENVWSEF